MSVNSSTNSTDSPAHVFHGDADRTGQTQAAIPKTVANEYELHARTSSEAR
jgi:hypothetical protein